MALPIKDDSGVVPNHAHDIIFAIRIITCSYYFPKNGLYVKPLTFFSSFLFVQDRSFILVLITFISIGLDFTFILGYC